MAVDGGIGCDNCLSCESGALPPWEEPICQTDWVTVSSEINYLYLSDVDDEAIPVGGAVNFADATSFGAAISQTGAGWRCICGTGNLPRPEETVVEGSCCRSKTTARDWQMVFDVDNLPDENYNFWATIGECSWSGRAAFGTRDKIFADTLGNGIQVQINAYPEFARGKGNLMKIIAEIEWSGLCWPVLVGDHPFTIN